VTNFASFTSNTNTLIYLNWYAGEVATAVIVSNIPLLWPLVSTVFRLGSFHKSAAGTTDRHTKKAGYTLQSITKGNDFMPSSSSEERIADLDDVDFHDTKHPDDLVLTVDKGRTTTHVVAGWHDDRDPKLDTLDHKDFEALDRDLEKGSNGQIVKTVNVSQFRHDY